MDENLNKLEEIGKEIENIEKKLEELPIEDPNLDMSKFNRKQRRKIQRDMIHEEKAKQKLGEQRGNTFVTRREFAALHSAAQKLRDRLYYVDILVNSIEKLLIDKNILTEDEIKNTVKSESEKAMTFQEIQKGIGDYENRLNKCKELEIDPNISIIGQQIYEDASMEISEKLRLAKEYNLTILLKVLEEQNKADE